MGGAAGSIDGGFSVRGLLFFWFGAWIGAIGDG